MIIGAYKFGPSYPGGKAAYRGYVRRYEGPKRIDVWCMEVHDLKSEALKAAKRLLKTLV